MLRNITLILIFSGSVFAMPQKSIKLSHSLDDQIGKSTEQKHRVIITASDAQKARNLPISSKRVYKTMSMASSTLSVKEIHRLERHPDVTRIELDTQVKAFAGTANYWYGVEAAREKIGVDGSGIAVAVIDTGIDASHVDLAGKVIGWKDEVGNKTTPYDDQCHGTHVVGIVAGIGAGNPDLKGPVAPGADLVGVKVLNSAGMGFTSDIIAGIDWVIQNKDTYNIRVLNLSLGSGGSSNGKDASSAAEKALTVGATADPSKGGFNLAFFSSRGPTLDGRVKPDIIAPGYRISVPKTNSGNGYITYSGTSMATPFVAESIALMLRESFIAGKTGSRIIAPFCFKGACNTIAQLYSILE